MRIRKTQGGNIYLFIIYVILIQMGRGLNGLLGKFGIEYRYSLQPMYIVRVHCTVAVQARYIPYVMYCNPKKNHPQFP